MQHIRTLPETEDLQNELDAALKTQVRNQKIEAVNFLICNGAKPKNILSNPLYFLLANERILLYGLSKTLKERCTEECENDFRRNM